MEREDQAFIASPSLEFTFLFAKPCLLRCKQKPYINKAFFMKYIGHYAHYLIVTFLTMVSYNS